jgi:hypothetical protein
MKAMDFNQFVKKVTDLGYRIDHSAKHHLVVDAEGKKVAYFAVSHAKGAKKYVKAGYVKSVFESLKNQEETK